VNLRALRTSRLKPFSLRHPKTTVRWRLTLMYGALFLVTGAGLLAVTYTLVSNATVGGGFINAVGRTPGGPDATFPGGQLPIFIGRGALQIPTGVEQAAVATPKRLGGQRRSGGVFKTKVIKGPVPSQLRQILATQSGKLVVRYVGVHQRINDLHHLIVESAIALAIMTLLSAGLGWLVAGRVLRPLRTMTMTTQQISEANLHRRLAMHGPRDELRELADTIDGLLGRLEGAFDAQRRFVANASHELRTPLTAVRALLEMVLSDPNADVQTFRGACRQVLEESEQQEELIDALLALAHGQRGLDRAEPIDLGAVVSAALRSHDGEAATMGLSVDARIEPVTVTGDRRLVERLVSNLLDNALRHNVADGRVEVTLRAQGGQPVLVIANTGEHVPAEEVGRLLQPFQRLGPNRVGHGGGLGLGLSIVAAIAAAHDVTLTVTPEPDGGLRVEARFPATGSNVFVPEADEPPAPVLPLPAA
jgi:signal transduction histidine kinase